MKGRAEYETVPQQFNANRSDSESWAGPAKRAGGRFVILVSKHRVGFACGIPCVNPPSPGAYGQRSR